MKIIALESSAVTASVAVCEDEVLLAQSFQNSGLTHSATLMPMAVDLLKNAGLTLEEMDVVAVAAGPGSFTGVRIGVAGGQALRPLFYSGVYGVAGGSHGGGNLRGNGRPAQSGICGPISWDGRQPGADKSGWSRGPGESGGRGEKIRKSADFGWRWSGVVL